MAQDQDDFTQFMASIGGDKVPEPKKTKSKMASKKDLAPSAPSPSFNVGTGEAKNPPPSGKRFGIAVDGDHQFDSNNLIGERVLMMLANGMTGRLVVKDYLTDVNYVPVMAAISIVKPPAA